MNKSQVRMLYNAASKWADAAYHQGYTYGILDVVSHDAATIARVKASEAFSAQLATIASQLDTVPAHRPPRNRTRRGS